ncbi:hypothetical protein CKAH01_04575 [Colletotrichum kahawae]|uniref:C2H2-type domain-containing protein n=1 Tax=Colletotrichum kahawae TaxID=34407 RepID=A0AAD9YKG9_COLKA|nr:hypothetical protein CKAH01_04575 [Colletotrichum kahawae]
MVDHVPSADQLNPQHSIIANVDDTVRASTDDHLHKSSSGTLFNDPIPVPTTAHKSEDGLFGIPEVPCDSEVLRCKSPNLLPLDTDSCPTNQVGIPINIGDTLVDNESKEVLLERSKSSREPNDTKQHKTRLLACPYPKHDPETHGYRCRAAAFSKIHRLKEHLYRVHTQPPHCVRCGETFSNESDVKAHLGRPDEICDFVAGVSVDGLTSEQIKKLRSKKRKTGVTTIEEKWRHIFGILFPDATDVPDPYYTQFVDPSNDRKLLSIGQSDFVSIFSNVPPESEDRMFASLEQICGPLEKSKRRKVWNTVQNFFVERVQQIMGSGTISQNSRDDVHTYGLNTYNVSLKAAAPEVEERSVETRSPTKQKYSMDPGQTVLGTTSTTSDVENLQTDLLQDRLECDLFNLSNEQIFNQEIAGIESEARLNKCANAERSVSIPRSGIASATHAFDTLAPCEDLSCLLQPYGEFFDLDSILNEATDGSEHVDFTLADWPTGHSNL